MLIEFTVANFRSVLSPQKLSLVAGAGTELEARNLIPKEQDGLRLMRSAVIYGANAAGKTNVLRALATLRQLVEDTATKVQEGQRLNVAPFLLTKVSASQPSEFEIIFVADDGVRYHYFCAVGPERVHKEWMVAYPHGRAQRWFEREYDAEIGKYSWWFGPNFKAERAERKVWQDFTRANALFFSTAIQLNNDQLKPAFAWITQKLIVLTVGVSWNPFLTWDLLRGDSGRAQVMQYMRAADVGIDRLELIEEEIAPASIAELPLGAVRINLEVGVPEGAPLPKGKRFQVRAWHKQAGSSEEVALDIHDESEGTRKLFEFAGGWIRALEAGATLFVDELDRSLHPYMTRFLVGLFQGSTNARDAQLVFTTHDTTLLDSELLRRDQVWFVEKERDGSSKLYSLLEYSPRKDEAFERGYLKGRYGAVPLIGNLRN
ncbi:MAG: ATP-binding protein [Gammaproteobacteria bacterium]